MKKAILILALSSALSTQTAVASDATNKDKYVLQPMLLNGQVVYVQVLESYVTKTNQPILVKPAVKKSTRLVTADGLRRTLLRSNFR